MSKNNNVIRKYDERGNEIYCKYYNGYQQWYEYDKNGNMIHYKNSDGHEVWYDDDGNVIQTKGSYVF